MLPQLDGSAFPAFRVAFENGECDADDPGGPGTGTINTAKRCYSCFRFVSVRAIITAFCVLRSAFCVLRSAFCCCSAVVVVQEFPPACDC